MPTSASTNSFYFGRRTGAPFYVGSVEIIPESLVLLVRTHHWGLVWNWPIAVSVTRRGQAEGSSVERLAIVDATRLALWSLALATVVMALGFAFLPNKR